MKTKFQPGDKVLHNGEEREVIVSRKDFSNQSIIYKLDNDEQVSEGELSPVKGKLTRKKKLSKKDSDLLAKRLDMLEDYIPMITADEDFDKETFNNVLVSMTVKQFDKFTEDLIEKSILESESDED